MTKRRSGEIQANENVEFGCGDAGAPRGFTKNSPPAIQSSDADFELGEDGEPIFVVPIEEAIDLHTFQPREVLGVVDAYLDAALERGFREVRLIHGRGKGVQRANVQRSLARDARVDRYADAPQHRGGWGATLVWLRPSSEAPSKD